MTTIGLVRHGVTEWNELGKVQGKSNIPLNERGRQQAFALANRLALEESWDFIFSSDLTRAVETTNIISTKLGLSDIYFDERIREIDCGEIEGTNEQDRVSKWGSEWRSLELGMESFEDVSKRGTNFLEEIVEKYKGKRILVVSHGAIISLTLNDIVPEDKENYERFDADITEVYEKEITPIEKKAGGETFTELPCW